MGLMKCLLLSGSAGLHLISIIIQAQLAAGYYQEQNFTGSYKDNTGWL